MLSYSACSDFYKCPCLYQHRDELKGLTTEALTIGANIDTILNAIMLSRMEDKDFAYQRSVEIGISDLMRRMAENNDICNMIDVPMMVKQWYIDFVQSGLRVVDVQKHFVLDELDYHGYIDAVMKDKDDNLIVIENKTTSKFYDSYFSNKKNSYQGVSYALAMGTDHVRYQFFNTKNMTEYFPASRFVTEQDIQDFKDWVLFVKNNEKSFVKNMEYCSLNNCFYKEMCLYERNE